MQDTMPGDPTDPTARLRRDVRAALDAAWVAGEGYTAPNTEVYPWLWLWDSCFHSLVWLALGEPDRAVRELEAAIAPDRSGFVPHMGYELDPQRSVELWGRPGSSSITQPPMYGHALAELRRAGVAVDHLIDRATLGIRFLLDRRSRTDGLIEVVHPWETGCDDSPRWDSLCPGDGFDRETWRHHKMDLLATVERGHEREPLHNPAFPVASVGFNALVAFNARELMSVTGDRGLAKPVADLVEAIDARFEPDLRTWVDAGPTAAGSGRARTIDGLLPLLVTADADARVAAISELLAPSAYASPFGPRGVHLAEPTYDGTTYWRGPVWPQLAYLLWVALRRGGPAEQAAADAVRSTTRAGAIASGLAEYWDAESGSGLGAIPQSWTGLVLLLGDAG